MTGFLVTFFIVLGIYIVGVIVIGIIKRIKHDKKAKNIDNDSAEVNNEEDKQG